MIDLNFDVKSSGLRTVNMEQKALDGLRSSINNDFVKACHLILECQGRVVVTGMGKSGHIGNKIAATLASTGTPAFFVHPGEASHGDMGMIQKDDVVIALSNSGEVKEVTALIPLLTRLGTQLISITGNNNSTLAKAAQAPLLAKVEEEACPLNLAPTSSTTAALVLGDALAVALLESRGFTAEDFAFSHPGGSLGKKLLLKVEDLMHQGARIAKVSPDTNLSDAILEMTEKGLGMTTVVDDQILIGVYTDGDLRRSLNDKIDFHSTAISSVCHRNPAKIKSNQLAAQALFLMQEKSITSLVVVDDKNDEQLVGLLHMHDLIRAGVA